MIRLFFTGNTRYLRLGGSRLPNIGSLIIPVHHSSFIDSISSGCTCSLRRQSRPFRSRCRRATARLVQYGGKVVYNSQVAARYMYFWAVINTVHVLNLGYLRTVLYCCKILYHIHMYFNILSSSSSSSFRPSNHHARNNGCLASTGPHPAHPLLASAYTSGGTEVPRYLVTVFSHT